MGVYSKKTEWDYQTTYVYALKLLCSRACTRKSLRSLLSRKSSVEIADTITSDINILNMLNDTQLCLDTAAMWVQKKPISRIELFQKLANFGFCTNDIRHAIAELEARYANQEVQILGGYSCVFLEDYQKNILQLGFWDAMAVSACIYSQAKANHTVTPSAMRARLTLRGFNANVLRNMVKG